MCDDISMCRRIVCLCVMIFQCVVGECMCVCGCDDTSVCRRVCMCVMIFQCVGEFVCVRI